MVLSFPLRAPPDLRVRVVDCGWRQEREQEEHPGLASMAGSWARMDKEWVGWAWGNTATTPATWVVRLLRAHGREEEGVMVVEAGG
jgi:hypothetical protein